MGHSKRLHEEMMLDEFLNGFFNQETGDEDYQYDLYKQRKMDEYNQQLMEQEAYEEHLSDKY